MVRTVFELRYVVAALVSTVVLAVIVSNIVPVLIVFTTQETSGKPLELCDRVNRIFGPVCKIKIHVQMSPLYLSVTECFAVSKQPECLFVRFTSSIDLGDIC